MKLAIVTVLLLQGFVAQAATKRECRFWQPDQRVQAFHVSEEESHQRSLHDKSFFVKAQILETGELSIALFRSKTNDLVSVARGTAEVTLSVMEPRFIIACYPQ